MLDGNANFTLQTLAKVAIALGGVLHLHISDPRAKTTWRDELPAEDPRNLRR